MISVSSWITTDPTFSPSSTEVKLATPGLIPPPAHDDDPGHALGMITTAGTVIGYWVKTSDDNHIYGKVTARTSSGKVMNRLEDSPCLKATVSPDLVAELNGSDRAPGKLAPSPLAEFYEHRRNLEGLRRATTGYWQQWLTELTAEGLTPAKPSLSYPYSKAATASTSMTGPPHTTPATTTEPPPCLGPGDM